MSQTPVDPIKDIHKWADYLELRCLTSLDRYITLGDAAGWFRIDQQDGPADDGERLSAITQVQDEWDYSETDLDSDPLVSDTDVDSAARVDNRQRLAEDAFRLLTTRAGAYGEAYPFAISEDGLALHCKSTLGEQARLYIFLLLCASGRYVTQHQVLTTTFERVSAAAMRQMLPNAEVHIFGTAGTGSGRYDGGTFKRKVSILANDLGEVPGPLVASIDDHETADRGLDFVGWVNLGDELPSRLVVFGQAACTDNWVVKQDSPSSEAWDQIMLVTCPPIIVCCIPHCFRNAAGAWHDQLKIHRRLLVDRRRMVHLLQEVKGIALSDEVLDEFLSYRMSA